MAAPEEPLKDEIERAKHDLARDLDELRGRAGEAGKRIAIVIGVLVAAYAAFRMIRFLRGRGGRD